MSTALRMAVRPMTTPPSAAATRRSLGGSTSSSAAPSTASAGMRMNLPGVRSGSWFGISRAKYTSTAASPVVPHDTARAVDGYLSRQPRQICQRRLSLAAGAAGVSGLSGLSGPSGVGFVSASAAASGSVAAVAVSAESVSVFNPKVLPCKKPIGPHSRLRLSGGFGSHTASSAG